MAVVHVVAFGGVVLGAAAAGAAQEITLASRRFAPESPALPLQSFLVEARRRAAATTVAWDDTEDDLAAWGPALVFPLLGAGVPGEDVLALGAPLAAEAPAPVLLFRTLGLYAVKSRVPFVETPDLLAAIRRNLRLMERATRDLERFTGGPELQGWGSIGVGAWLAYLELLYRDYGELGSGEAAHWTASGVRIVEQILVRGRLENGGFRRDPRDTELTLWPTALALHALMQAYENQESIQYESAAMEAAAAIQVLRDRDGAYFSTMAGGQKDPRANAYLAGGFLLLYKNTGEPRFRDGALSILRWLTGPQNPPGSAPAGSDLHAAYLALLLDSLAMQTAEPILGRRPLRAVSDRGDSEAVRQMAVRLSEKAPQRAMLSAMLQTLLLRTPYASGDFAYDYGDSPGYAAAVLLRGGRADLAQQVITRQEDLLVLPRPAHFDELSFGASALLMGLDHPEVIDAAKADAALRRYLFLSALVVMADRYYLDGLDWYTGGGGFDYGPTVLGAQVAAVHLRFGKRFPGVRVGWVVDPLAIGRRILETTDREAWDGTRRIYRLRRDDEVVALLPNAMMVLALLEAHAMDPAGGHLSRAEEVFDGLETLWDESRGAYLATSAHRGEDAYFSLSTSTYAWMASRALAAATGKARYGGRAAAIRDFIARDLYADGIAYHHLHRGRRATGDIWCSGCNWRVAAALVEHAEVAATP
jgi:hypothetical protein